MPVPLIASNPSARPLLTTTNEELPTDGPFARLKAQQEQAHSQKKDSSTAPKAELPVVSSTQPPTHSRDVTGGTATPFSQPPASADLHTFHSSQQTAPSLLVKGLTFSYPGLDGRPVVGQPPLISDLNLSLLPGSRCLLIGSNGAGKTTLLKILAGKHMVAEDQVTVLGKPPFSATELTTSGVLSYCGGNWTRDIAFAGYSIPLTGDFPASKMINSVPGVDPARKKRLMEALDVDPDWRMHLVSDGQRRRVQICVSLLKPFQVLLLDEITVDLDVLGRAELMKFLKEECESRGATIVYATHIFDGLESWPTHIAYMASGHMRMFKAASDIAELKQGRLLELVVALLKQEQQNRPKRHILEWDESQDGLVGNYSMVFNNGWTPGTLNPSMKLSTNAVMRM